MLICVSFREIASILYDFRMVGLYSLRRFRKRSQPFRDTVNERELQIGLQLIIDGSYLYLKEILSELHNLLDEAVIGI